jgi:NAD(P)-dependent dehydrogenase (short-subunit alcohol dehydrogenase family)
VNILDSLLPSSSAAVIGASGGIGSAVVELLGNEPRIKTIHAFTRAPLPASTAKVSSQFIDITREDSIRDAAAYASAHGPLDLVLVATGVLHRGEHLQPEKCMQELQAEKLAEVFAVNAIGPAIVGKHFLPLLRRDHKTVFAVLSARVGSITDNRLGGWPSYRASKAALNMLLRTMAIEHARRWPASVIAALHPGTVDTALSGPFSSRVPAAKLFSPADAAIKIVAVINRLTPTDSGGFFAWDGNRIEFYQ